MKMKTFALALCLAGFTSAVHAHPNAIQGVLVDNGAPLGNIGGVSIELLDDGVPTQLSEQDAVTMQVASSDGTGGAGCRTINGQASIYGLNHGSGDSSNQKLAAGGRLNVNAMTAAMLHVPLGKTVQVSRGGRTISVRVNDRGPYARGRVIDLTPAAASALGFSERGAGVASVSVLVCT